MKIMILTEEHQISTSHPFWDECDLLCFKSKNLYNSCIYTIRQHLLTTGAYSNGKYPVYSAFNLYHILIDSKDFRTDENEHLPTKINTKCLRYVYRQVHNIYNNHFKALKSYKFKKSKFLGLPKLPSYKDKQGRNILTFNKEALSFKDKGYICLSMTDIKIKTNLKKEAIKEVSIVPSTNCYKILIKHERSNTEIVKEHKKFAAIDLGINNLIALTSNDIGIKPIVVNGRPLKSINQYYNKSLAKKKSALTDTKTSQSIKILTRKRNNKVKNFMHNTSCFVLNYLLENDITCLIIGKNDNWKQNINLGKKNNQCFVQIPFNMLINQLKYKCEMFGIEVFVNEESYTSKCSFLDMEPICKQDEYLGKRVKRGLFKSASGKTINADINGSLNIMRKVTGTEAFASYPVEAYAVMPTLKHICCI